MSFEYNAFFYRPHTMVTLCAFLVLLYWLVDSDKLGNLAILFSLNEDKSESELSRQADEYQRNGAFIGVCLAFVVFGSIHLPNTIMSRPHPLFWRILLALFTLYSMFITYMALLPVD